jgi:hypothetical protein
MIHENITREEYSKLSGMNWSCLKQGWGKPEQYAAAYIYNALHWHERDYDNEYKSTTAKLFGTNTHAAILEPHIYRELKVKDSKTTSVDGCITRSDQKKIAKIVELVERSNPGWIHNIQTFGRNEFALTWTCPVTGVECKCLIDSYYENILTDLKTDKDGVDEQFEYTATGKYLYIGQSAMYTDGLIANGMPVDKTQILALKTQSPLQVGWWEVGEMALEQGRQLYQSLLRLWQATPEQDRVALPAHHGTIQPHSSLEPDEIEEF